MITTVTTKQKLGKEVLRKSLDLIYAKAKELNLAFEIIDMPSEEISNETSHTEKKSLLLENPFDDTDNEIDEEL